MTVGCYQRVLAALDRDDIVVFNMERDATPSSPELTVDMVNDDGEAVLYDSFKDDYWGTHTKADGVVKLCRYDGSMGAVEERRVESVTVVGER